MNNITFANPDLLYLLLLIIPLIVWYVFKHHNINASIQVSTLKGIGNKHVTYKHILRHALFALGLSLLHYSLWQ